MAAPERSFAARLRRLAASDRGLFLCALLIRLGLTFLYSRRHVTVTGLELGTLADNLLAGRGFVWEFYGSTVPRTSFFPPFYPAFIALLKLIFGASGWVMAMQVVQALVSAATAVVTRRLAACVFGAGPERAPVSRPSAVSDVNQQNMALAAGYAVALWPPLIVYSAAAYSVTWEALLVPWIALLLFTAGRSRRFADAARAGVGYGILAYALPAFLGSILFLPAAFRAMGARWTRAIGLGFVTLAAALLVVLPWTIRNARIHHRFIPVATNIGFNYLGGQNAYARPHTNILCAYDDLRWKVIDKQALETMNEADFDQLLLKEGLAFARAEPWLTVRRSAERLLYYWWGSPAIRRYNPEQGVVNMALMSAVLPVFLIGLAASFAVRERYAILYAVFLWQSLFYMNFAIRGRYALVSHPLLLVVAVAGAAALGAWLAGARRRGERA